jgi:DNA invertase Pin-like site-specific DNA recombinase
MATVGYARVSSIGQSLDVQLEKLRGCDTRRGDRESMPGGQLLSSA